MADLVEVFRTLADSGTGAGEPLISRVEGEAAAGQEGSIAFSFKDSSGNVVLPQLDSLGRLIVVSDAAAGDCKYAVGELAAGSVGTLADVTGASITLTVGKTYTNIGVEVSATRTSVFELQYVDDSAGTPAVTVLGRFVVGAGQYSFCCQLHCRHIDTTGGTGVNLLRLQGKNNTHASCLRGSISALELAS